MVALICSDLPEGRYAETTEDGVAHAPARLGVDRLGHLLDGLQDADVLLLELLERMVKLGVPRVQDEDLEAEGRGGDDEVRRRDEACPNHLCFVFFFFSVYLL